MRDIYKYIDKGYCYDCDSYYPINEMRKKKSDRRGYINICKFCYNERVRLKNGSQWMACQEIRQEVMAETLPLYEKRLEFIKKCNLSIDKPEDTGKIDVVLGIKGL